jgi:hypothetical protein
VVAAPTWTQQRTIKCVLQGKGGAVRMQSPCITQHPDFEATVLCQSVLTVSIRMRNNLRRTSQREPFTHDLLRHQAYTQFSMWVHNKLGRGVRRVVPACAVHLVHKAYPDARGQYHGFDDGLSDDSDWDLIFCYKLQRYF